MLSILEQIRNLDPYEQLTIVDSVWSDLSQPEAEDDVDFAEIRSRVEEYERDKSTAIPADLLLTELKSEYNY